MIYPTRIRYGLRLMAFLALQEKGRNVSVNSVAAGEDISVKYLEQIISALRPLGCLRSLRGSHGGYALKKSPEEITVGEIIGCLGGMDAPVPCIGKGCSCARANHCATRPFWIKYDNYVRDFLQRMTLADLVADAPPAAISRILCAGDFSLAAFDNDLASAPVKEYIQGSCSDEIAEKNEPASLCRRNRQARDK